MIATQRLLTSNNIDVKANEKHSILQMHYKKNSHPKLCKPEILQRYHSSTMIDKVHIEKHLVLYWPTNISSNKCIMTKGQNVNSSRHFSYNKQYTKNLKRLTLQMNKNIIDTNIRFFYLSSYLLYSFGWWGNRVR